MNIVYLDNNATTKPAPKVVEAMIPFISEAYGNPSSIHRMGQRAKQALDESRHKVAQLIRCAESEVTFTGGGTESINTALRGFLNARAPLKTLVTTTVEHSASRTLCKQLAKEGFTVIQLEVDQQGHLNMDEVRRVITAEVAVVSVMWANNETGVLFPVEEIAKICKQHRVPFHCDATQVVGKMPVDFGAVGFDAMSFAAHKFHGPKGVGGLILKRGARMRSLILGGPQEHERRGGTENVPAIVGMGVACELAAENMDDMTRVGQMRDRLEASILERIPETHVNGDRAMRLCNTTNIGFAALEAEAILLLLSEQGVCASAGSACSSGSLEPSPVLRAMKIDDRIGHGSVRFSFSHDNTDADVDRTLEVLPKVIQKLRAVLPVG